MPCLGLEESGELGVTGTQTGGWWEGNQGFHSIRDTQGGSVVGEKTPSHNSLGQNLLLLSPMAKLNRNPRRHCCSFYPSASWDSCLSIEG